MVIGNILISIIFITVGEILHKVILGELWLIRARLVTKRTIIG